MLAARGRRQRMSDVTAVEVRMRTMALYHRSLLRSSLQHKKCAKHLLPPSYVLVVELSDTRYHRRVVQENTCGDISDPNAFEYRIS
uniref:Uncharacterized protein n=1 Tax=Ascaris lumbricoides TaxID=6252 RepID=A0A0M3I7K5_ASCLU